MVRCAFLFHKRGSPPNTGVPAWYQAPEEDRGQQLPRSVLKQNEIANKYMTLLMYL